MAQEAQAAEATLVALKQGRVAEAKIVDQQVEAVRQAKDEWRERKEPKTELRAVEDSLQRERKETRAVPKSGIVHSGGAARMIRGISSTLTTIAIAGAIGFGTGVYVTPTDKADEFRAFVNSKLDEINGLMHRERAVIGPKAKAPSEAAAPMAPMPLPRKSNRWFPPSHRPRLPPWKPRGRKTCRTTTRPVRAHAQRKVPQPVGSRSGPERRTCSPFHERDAVETENFEQAKPVAKKVQVAKPHPKPPVKKVTPKPKPKPAEHQFRLMAPPKTR